MKTARKAVQLLRQFSRAEPELGVRDLARRLDMDSASVHRLLRALLAERFVEQDPLSRRYRLGFGVVDLAAIRICQHGLLAIASPYLEQLRDETGETVALLVPDHLEAVCLAVVESRQSVRVGYEIGERIPLHASAGGQVLLAYFNQADRQAVYAAGLTRFTPRTLTDPVALEDRLAHIRADRSGWAEDSYFQDVVSAAAPVIDPKQSVAGVVTLAAPMHRCGLTELPRLSLAARRTADAIALEWAGGFGGAQRLALPVG